MLKGNLFAEPMYSNLRDMPEYHIEPEVWAIMTVDTASSNRSKIMMQDNTLIRDEIIANQVGSIATQLRNSYTFHYDFLDCMKMK